MRGKGTDKRRAFNPAVAPVNCQCDFPQRLLLNFSIVVCWGIDYFAFNLYSI